MERLSCPFVFFPCSLFLLNWKTSTQNVQALTVAGSPRQLFLMIMQARVKSSQGHCYGEILRYMIYYMQRTCKLYLTVPENELPPLPDTQTLESGAFWCVRQQWVDSQFTCFLRLGNILEMFHLLLQLVDVMCSMCPIRDSFFNSSQDGWSF